MVLDRENRNPDQELEKNHSFDFDPEIINLMPSEHDRQGLLKMHLREVHELKSGKLRQRMIEVVGKEITSAQISQLLQFSDREIESQTLMCTGDKRNFLETSTILYSKQNDTKRLEGIVNLAFVKGLELFLLIRHRDLEITGEQLGLEIQCRLEYFCRDCGIWKIRNVARSQPKNYLGRGNRREIGAYVWARCGFEFSRKVDAYDVMCKFSKYKTENKIEPEVTFTGFGRAIDYARIKGRDSEGNVIPIGKNFLMNTSIEWEGVRDLKPDSESTKIFIKYLTERGRMDLIEKYLNPNAI